MPVLRVAPFSLSDENSGFQFEKGLITPGLWEGEPGLGLGRMREGEAPAEPAPGVGLGGSLALPKFGDSDPLSKGRSASLMRIPARSIQRRHFLKASATATLAAVGLSGCSRGIEDAQALRVASPWPDSVREELEREFAAWLRDHGEADHPPIFWITVPEGEPLDRFLRRSTRLPDVFLGGPVDDYARLAAEGRLEGLGNATPRPYWREMDQSGVGLARKAARDPRPALGDPRVDPLTRAWCLGELQRGDWPASYAMLVDHYGRSAVAAGWRSGSARAAFDQGRVDEAILEFDPDAEDNAEIEIMGEPIPYVEGAAVRAGSPRTPMARELLGFLGEQRNAKAGPATEGRIAIRADARDLATDLLGATLVDAQDELRIAGAAVRKAGSPKWAVELLTTVPPWPPASVQKLLAKDGESGLELLDTLIVQIAPEAGSRVWLAQSWLKAAKPIDDAILYEIARVEGGRLAREPRFRAWLRAEWTQWARQRYRWVSRLAASGAPPSSSAVSGSRDL